MNENENIEELYTKHYYPNITRFYQILKENGIKKTLKEVKEFIALQGINQIHKLIIKRRNQERPIVAMSPNEQLQIDLLDYSNFPWMY